ncbi:MAG: pirin family protein [Flavobacterium sp.]|nr:pirin family protein [Flavobacterium sp.]
MNLSDSNVSYATEFSVLHKAGTRGITNKGWMESRQTFSFGEYHNIKRKHFGVLRVLNDDSLEAGMGFGMHPHDNMEIINILLEGELEHKDNIGNSARIKKGDVQVISAGTGVFHSEYNISQEQPVKFLQIWLYPNQKNVTPRYDQITLKENNSKNRFQQILSPNPEDEGVWIHQQSWFHMGLFNGGLTIEYTIKKEGNGVYVFMINGNAKIGNQVIEKRDGFGIWNTQKLTITIGESEAEILLMEVPMMI